MIIIVVGTVASQSVLLGHVGLPTPSRLQPKTRARGQPKEGTLVVILFSSAMVSFQVKLLSFINKKGYSK